MTQTLTTIGHRAAFNNEQNPYRIVSYMLISNNYLQCLTTINMAKLEVGIKEGKYVLCSKE